MTGRTSGGPLAGIRVVEFAGLSPVSVAGMLLCGMGAEVIRIDRRDHEADGCDNTLRRGRRSIVLDLKHPGSAEVVRRLVRSADILIEAYRPGVMERLGLGPELVLSENPRLVYGRLTGWGQHGPYAQMAGHDITYLAVTGALYSLGPPDGPPVPPANYVADMGGGTMFLLLGLLAALHERNHSGRGQVVDAAMVDAVPTLAATVLRARANGEWSDDRGNNYLDGGAPFYRTYECRDGGYVAVGAIEPKFYRSFVSGLGLDVSTLPDQWDRSAWSVIAAQFAREFRKKSRAEWEHEFDGTDACVAPVLNFAEAPLHPHVAARRAFAVVDDHWQPGAAPKLDRTPLAVPDSLPRRGSDTLDVLRDLGFSPAEIEDMLRDLVAYSGGDAQ